MNGSAGLRCRSWFRAAGADLFTPAKFAPGGKKCRVRPIACLTEFMLAISCKRLINSAFIGWLPFSRLGGTKTAYSSRMVMQITLRSEAQKPHIDKMNKKIQQVDFTEERR